MSDLVLRAIGQAVCLSTVGIFALVMTLVSLTSASADSRQSCRAHHCPALVAEPEHFASPAHVRAVAAHLWGTARS